MHLDVLQSFGSDFGGSSIFSCGVIENELDVHIDPEDYIRVYL
jgi:hypothetical protein